MQVVDPMYFRLISLIQALKIHVRTGGKMRLTRTATPTRLLAMATQYTGMVYKRGQYTMAIGDLELVKQTILAEAHATQTA